MGTHSPVLKLLPAALTTYRIGLAAVLFGIIASGWPRSLLSLIVLGALLSDWLDGVIARRLGIATPWLRRYDVLADIVFYLSAVIAAFLLEPEQMRPYGPWLAFLLAVEVFVQVWHYLRWRLAIATHSWTCKAWSVVMAVSLTVLLGFGHGGWLLFTAFLLGSAAYVDVVLILCFAHQVPLDTVSFWHVWRDAQRQGVAP